MPDPLHVAHMNFARLRHPPGDPRVAEFIDNVPRVNAIAGRRPGFVWRLDDRAQQVDAQRAYQALWDDPCLIVSLSVRTSRETLLHFVRKTVHGDFFRRRDTCFESVEGPNYVLWDIELRTIPTIGEARARLDRPRRHGPSEAAYDFGYVRQRVADELVTSSASDVPPRCP